MTLSQAPNNIEKLKCKSWNTCQTTGPCSSCQWDTALAIPGIDKA